MSPKFTTHRPVVSRLVLAITLLVVYATAARAQQGNTDKTILSIQRNSIDNTPSSISFSPAASWHAAQAGEIWKKYLGITDGDEVMKLASTTTTPAKITTQRYAQYYKGLKVQYGGYTLTVKDDIVNFMTGNYYSPADKPSDVPGISADAARAKALDFVGAEKYKWQDSADEAHIKARYKKADTSYYPKGQLVWIEDMRTTPRDRKLHLAYSFNIYADKPLSRQEVFIDAHTGKVLFSNQLLKHTNATGKTLYSGVIPFRTAHIGSNYRLFDSTRGSGVHTLSMHNGTNYAAATEITSATNIFPILAVDTAALDAHWGGEVVYDYWLTQQGRHSWDDLDGILEQYVHFSNNYNNAYWDGAEMTYGDGSGIAAGGFSPLTSIDVTAHEIGHGVCEATANLIYELESGALNEGFSDCWAATIENWSDPHEIDAMPKHPWEMGEEIGTEPIRSMSTPLLQGQPNTYGSTNWYNVVACTPSGGNDQCGVHTNSGLLNYWYYLLVNGGVGVNGIGNAYIVNPLGWTNSGAVLYQTELMLASNATYADCRLASINAATALFGPCSAQVQCVTSAWYAVGVGANYVPCSAQIGFTATSTRVTETAPTITCPASKTITIGLKAYGPVIAGGSVTANIVAAPTSTALSGVDYSLSTTSTTFPPGDISTHFITVTIFDNGAVHDDKHIDLAFSLAPGSSTAVISPIYDSLTIFIDNNDSTPQKGGIQYHTLDAGTPVVSDVSTAFYGSRRRAHSQFLILASEMAAAGVIPNAPISQVAFNVLIKSSTAPFTNYTISMRNTTTASLATAFITALTQVYTGNHTTNLGMDSVDFNTSTFTWDGTSNVAVEICFGMTAAAFAANDKVAGVQQGAFTNGYYIASNTGAGVGCSLTFGGGDASTARPVMRFKQTVTPATVETAITSNRVWNVKAGQEVYFYNPTNSKVIAGLKNVSNDLGCVTATVSQQGAGFVPAVFSAINRSVKELTITPTINGSITSYDATLYLTNAELSGVAAGTLFILKTDEPTDATISSLNSIVVTPTLITGTNYVGFTGSFTGFSRFMLVDGQLCTTPAATITPAGPLTFCEGGSVLLTANTGAGLTYQWQKDGINIAGATTASYTATQEAGYVVVVNQSVCTNTSASVAVNVDSFAMPAITGSGAVCIGQSVTLAHPVSGGVWGSGSTGIATVSGAGVVTGVAAGVANISYTITNFCGALTAVKTVTVSAPVAVAAITGASTLCQGATTTLSDATPLGNWSSGSSAVASVSAGGVVTGMSAGTAAISYSVANALGCLSSAIKVVTINAAPAAAVSPAGPVTLCTGASVVLGAASGAGLSYQWQSGGIAIAGATSASFTANTAGMYNVVVTNSGGCQATSATVTIAVNPSPTITPSVNITVSPGTVLCAASIVATYTATPANGGSAPAYQWAVNGVPAATGVTFSYLPSAGDVVSCTLTSNAMCAFPVTATNSVTMTVSPLLMPSVSVAASPNDTLCTGSMVTLAAVPVNGGPSPEYLWTENGINVATGPHYLYVPNDGDVIVCTMTSDFACLATHTAVSAPLVLHTKAPSVNTIAIAVSPAIIPPGTMATFVASAPNAGPAATYQWYINGVLVPGVSGATYTTDSAVNGQVVSAAVSSSILCAAPQVALSNSIVVHAAVGFTTINGGNTLAIMPNPNKGTFTLAGIIGASADDKLAVIVTDVLGQVVYSTTATANNGEVNEQIALPQATAPGIYLVSVTAGGVRQVFHMVIDK